MFVYLNLKVQDRRDSWSCHNCHRSLSLECSISSCSSSSSKHWQNTTFKFKKTNTALALYTIQDSEGSSPARSHVQIQVQENKHHISSLHNTRRQNLEFMKPTPHDSELQVHWFKLIPCWSLSYYEFNFFKFKKTNTTLVYHHNDIITHWQYKKTVAYWQCLRPWVPARTEGPRSRSTSLVLGHHWQLEWFKFKKTWTNLNTTSTLAQ